MSDAEMITALDQQLEIQDKEPYTAPKLTVHGNAEELTQAGAATTNDGGGLASIP